MSWIKTTGYAGFDIFSDTVTGFSNAATVYSDALSEFPGDVKIVGTVDPSANVTASTNEVFLQISLDGTNWVNAVTGTLAAAFSAAHVETAFTIDATGVVAPYYRFMLYCDSGALTGYVVWKWAKPKKSNV